MLQLTQVTNNESGASGFDAGQVGDHEPLARRRCRERTRKLPCRFQRSFESPRAHTSVKEPVAIAAMAPAMPVISGLRKLCNWQPSDVKRPLELP